MDSVSTDHREIMIRIILGGNRFPRGLISEAGRQNLVPADPGVDVTQLVMRRQIEQRAPPPGARSELCLHAIVHLPRIFYNSDLQLPRISVKDACVLKTTETAQIRR